MKLMILTLVFWWSGKTNDIEAATVASCRAPIVMIEATQHCEWRM